MSVDLIETASRFDHHYKKLPKRLKELAKGKESIFRVDPFDHRLKTHKLHGKDSKYWAFSVDNRYRIKFIFIAEEHVLFLDIGTHDIYS